MANRKSRKRLRRPVRIPSVYRYMLLGLILPVSVVIGMVSGYNYGQAFGELSAAFFAAAGSVVGLTAATIVIVKVALFWERKILRQVKTSKARRSGKGK